jgi:hypothetical protein
MRAVDADKTFVVALAPAAAADGDDGAGMGPREPSSAHVSGTPPTRNPSAAGGRRPSRRPSAVELHAVRQASWDEAVLNTPRTPVPPSSSNSHTPRTPHTPTTPNVARSRTPTSSNPSTSRGDFARLPNGRVVSDIKNADAEDRGSESSEASHASAHLMKEQLDILLADETGDEYRTGVVGGGGGGPSEALSAFAAFLSAGGNRDDAAARQELAAWLLPSRVAHAWRRFVLCAVHLRFADSAEQQHVSCHAGRRVFPMATPLALAADAQPGHRPETRAQRAEDEAARRANACPSQATPPPGQPALPAEFAARFAAARAELPRVRHPGDRPTRRASLFGRVVGTYRCATYEGTATLRRCVGHDLGGVSQSLRVRKSQTAHRVARPPLHYRDLPGREHEPRCLPSSVTVQVDPRERERER